MNIYIVTFTSIDKKATFMRNIQANNETHCFELAQKILDKFPVIIGSIEIQKAL